MTTQFDKHWLSWTAASGFTAVALGAFAAHALKSGFDENQITLWRTALQYQLFHTLALLVLALLPPKAWFRASRITLLLGMVLFSGSLYLLALTQVRSIGIITPIGGILLLSGWLCLFIGAIRSTSVKTK